MNQFTEFEVPKEQPKATTEEVRALYPLMSAEIDVFKAVFGNDLKVDMIEEGANRTETKAYRQHLTYTAITGEQYIRLGEIGRSNSKLVNRAKNGR